MTGSNRQPPACKARARIVGNHGGERDCAASHHVARAPRLRGICVDSVRFGHKNATCGQSEVPRPLHPEIHPVVRGAPCARAAGRGKRLSQKRRRGAHRLARGTKGVLPCKSIQWRQRAKSSTTRLVKWLLDASRRRNATLRELTLRVEQVAEDLARPARGSQRSSEGRRRRGATRAVLARRQQVPLPCVFDVLDGLIPSVGDD